MSDILASTEAGALKQASDVVATSDTLKTLTSKKIEIESIISLERTRILDEARKRDALQKNISDIESGLKKWDNLSETMSDNASHGVLASATDEVKKLIEERDKLQKDISTIFIDVANSLDAGPFTKDTTVPDIQKQYPAIRKIAQNKLKAYEVNVKKAEKTREDFILQKQKELEEVSLDIERAKYVKQSQLSEAITKVLMYIGIFLGLFLIRYIS